MNTVLIEIAGIIIAIAVCFVIVILLAVGMELTIGKPSCGQYGDATDRNTKHYIISGCFVEIDGQWMKKDTAEKLMSNDFRISQKGE